MIRECLQYFESENIFLLKLCQLSTLLLEKKTTGAKNKNEFLTDCKELFVTHSIHVLSDIIILFAKMGAFVTTTNIYIYARVHFHYGNKKYPTILKRVQVSLVQ